MISLEWDVQIQPLIDDVCLSVAAVMGGGAANLFREHSPVGLYTRVYEMTARHRRNFSDIDYMHARQVQAVASFCDCFRADNLATLNRHLQGVGLLVQWFGCFFHHLGVFRRRVYGDSCASSEEDMIEAVRVHYLHPQKEQVVLWFRGAWSGRRRLSDDALEAVRAIEKTDPSFHNTLFCLYLSCLRGSCASASFGDGVAYMTGVVQFFQEEEQLFLSYFRGFDPVFPRAVLREVLVLPRQDDLVRVWVDLVVGADVSGARVFARFFSQASSQDAWVRAHKDAAATLVRSCTNVGTLDAFLRSQLRFLHDVFDEQAHLRPVFVRVVEATVRGSFTPAATGQWVREAHRRLSACRPAAMLKLIGYCPDKDDLHARHHAFMRARLLSGSFDPRHELAVLDVLETSFGASFVLNMRLMLQENNLVISSPTCSLRRLSRVAWGFGGGGRLMFRPPDAVHNGLASLHAEWRNKTNPSARLELLPLEGSVVMTSGHVMLPTQAIVLLALSGVPLARQDLVAKLGVPDDNAHNLAGILHSLERAGLVVRGGNDQWHHAATVPPASLVPPPMPDSLFCGGGERQPQQTTAAVEAFIVRTLKKKQASGMSLSALCRLLAPHRRVRGIVDGLVRREYLAWQGQDRLVYLP